MSRAYEKDDVERLLSYMFNGGVAWRPEDVPDPDMPKAKANPALGGTSMAEKIDMERTWKWLRPKLRNPEILFYHFGDGKPVTAIAAFVGMAHQSVSESISYDVERLRNAMNTGSWKEERARLASTRVVERAFDQLFAD